SASAALRATALGGAGCLAYAQGDYASARMSFEESLSIHRELGDRRGIAVSLGNLGSLAYRMSDHASARALYEESLKIEWELGHKHEIAGLLRSFASLATALGQGKRAARLFGATSILLETLNAPASPVERDTYH